MTRSIELPPAAGFYALGPVPWSRFRAEVLAAWRDD